MTAGCRWHNANVSQGNALQNCPPTNGGQFFVVEAKAVAEVKRILPIEMIGA